MNYRKRRFLTAATPFALLGYLQLARHGDPLLAVGMGLICGVMMGAVVDFLGQRASRELAAKNIDPENCPVRPRVQLTVHDLRPQLVLERVRSAASAIGARAARQFGTETIEFETPWTRHGAGEVIRAELAEHGGGTRLVLSSRPKWDTATIDFGRSVLQLTSVVSKLTDELKGQRVDVGAIEDSAS